MTQLIAIPLLTRHWGAEGYGIWLMLTTIPFYLSMSDFGLGTAAGVEIMRFLKEGDLGSARSAFQSVWVLLTATIGTILFIALIAASMLILLTPYSGDPWGRHEIAKAVVLMIIYSFGIVQMSIVYVVYRATHRYALGTVLLMSMFPLEGACLLITVLLGGGLNDVLIGYIILRALGAVAYNYVIYRRERWFAVGWDSARLSVIRSLAGPSTAVLSLNGSNIMVLQLLLVTLGAFAGPATVAVFGSVRFLARIPFQFFSMFERASVPEFTHAELHERWGLMRKMVRMNVTLGLLASLPVAIILTFFGQTLLGAISHSLHASQTLFFWLGMTTVFLVTWTGLATPLFATNQAHRYAYYFLAIALLVVLGPMLRNLLHIPMEPGTFSAMMLALGHMAMIVILWFQLSGAPWFRRKEMA
ncbi:lipopolysaccharide biosynthesis protein [Stakelama marina]|uniref:Polysaccharide biosynthesis protein n=1 Tax=Stakelama marina TaxID=2826939 RepID=A0A8T4IJ34_9SPHN|nr:hypothetical protein [Stakelama marina]MBR0554042.1 hypothetical protein [Stakelama marina]